MSYSLIQSIDILLNVSPIQTEIMLMIGPDAWKHVPLVLLGVPLIIGSASHLIEVLSMAWIVLSFRAAASMLLSRMFIAMTHCRRQCYYSRHLQVIQVQESVV